MRENKMHYDLKNVHYVPGRIQSDGTIIYSKPIRIPGAMSMDISAEGETTKIRADGIDYIVNTSNNGYAGSITLVKVPDNFRRDCLAEKIDTINGIQYEDANAEPNPFALIFEFLGDVKSTRHILYNNIATRIPFVAENKDNQKEPDTEEMEITSSPAVFNIDGEQRSIVKASTNADTPQEVYAKWYSKVFVPETSDVDTSLKTLEIDSLVFNPAYNKDIHVYTVTATEETNTITASATNENANIEITVNDAAVLNGGTVTWKNGINIVVITVMSGHMYDEYVIEVLKEVA